MKTVLLVDDDPALLELFSDVLSDSYLVVNARSVKEALESFKKHSVDAVISDLHLGHETADALLDWIFREFPQMATKTILLTGDHMINPNDYDDRLTILRKPVDIKTFEYKVSQLFDNQKGKEK